MPLLFHGTGVAGAAGGTGEWAYLVTLSSYLSTEAMFTNQLRTGSGLVRCGRGAGQHCAALALSFCLHSALLAPDDALFFLWEVPLPLHTQTYFTPLESAGPITVTLYEPHETPDTYAITFKSAERFDKWMDRGNIKGLFKDGKGPAINEFSDLMPEAMYTTAVCSIPARVASLEQYRAQLVRRGEQELTGAVLDDLASEGATAEELAEERVVKGGQGDAAEVDLVVRFVDAEGRTGFVIGSMKTTIGGDSDVSNLEKKVQQYFAPRAPFAGHPIQLAFMAETVRPDLMSKLKATCKSKNVRLYARNGRSISRVQLKAFRAVGIV